MRRGVHGVRSLQSRPLRRPLRRDRPDWREARQRFRRAPRPRAPGLPEVRRLLGRPRWKCTSRPHRQPPTAERDGGPRWSRRDEVAQARDRTPVRPTSGLGHPRGPWLRDASAPQDVAIHSWSSRLVRTQLQRVRAPPIALGQVVRPPRPPRRWSSRPAPCRWPGSHGTPVPRPPWSTRPGCAVARSLL